MTDPLTYAHSGGRPWGIRALSLTCQRAHAAPMSSIISSRADPMPESATACGLSSGGLSPAWLGLLDSRGGVVAQDFPRGGYLVICRVRLSADALSCRCADVWWLARLAV